MLQLECIICQESSDIIISVKGHPVPLCETCANGLLKELVVNKGVSTVEKLANRLYKEWIEKQDKQSKKSEEEDE